MMKAGGIGNVSYNAPFNSNAMLDSLAQQPREVDRRIYTDRLEGCACLATRWKGGFGKDVELEVVSSDDSIVAADKRRWRRLAKIDSPYSIE
jgi:hypothetical protein